MRASSLIMLLAAGGLVADVSPRSARAQEVVLDQGEYVLYVGDAEAGRETFELRRVGSGAEAKIWATATVELDEGTAVVSMRPVLQAAVDRSPLGYQNKITGAEDSEVQIGVADRRFVAMIKSAAGERGREMRAATGAVFLEGTVVHQYYFLPPASAAPAEIPVVVPRTGDQVRASMTSLGTETLRIAGRQVTAEKVRLEVGGEVREIWRDEDGRVLRVVIPSRSFRAERTEL